jgi:hypothetical protein
MGIPGTAFFPAVHQLRINHHVDDLGPKLRQTAVAKKLRRNKLQKSSKSVPVFKISFV